MVAYHVVSPPFITGTVDCSLGGAVERATIYVRWKVHKFTSSCDLRLRACSNGGTSCGQQDGRIVSFTTHCRYYMSLFIFSHPPSLLSGFMSFRVACYATSSRIFVHIAEHIWFYNSEVWSLFPWLTVFSVGCGVGFGPHMELNSGCIICFSSWR